MAAILSSIFIVLSVMAFVKSDYVFNEAFKNFKIFHIQVAIGVIIFSSCALASIVVFMAKMSAITITDNGVLGRNCFGLKKFLLFTEIKKAYYQDERGFESIVLYGGSFLNSIYFPVLLEEIESAIERLKQESITIENWHQTK